MRKHAASEYIQATGSSFWDLLSEAFAGCKEQLLEDKMKGIGELYEPAKDWQEVGHWMASGEHKQCKMFCRSKQYLRKKFAKLKKSAMSSTSVSRNHISGGAGIL